MSDQAKAPEMGDEEALGAHLISLDPTVDITGTTVRMIKSAFLAGIQHERERAKSENGRLRHINKKFKVYGTDGCKSCECGRVTLFIANDECISCNPESYELVIPVEEKNL